MGKRISYKAKWLKAEETIRKLKAHSMDLSEERREWMKKNNHPYIFHKSKGFLIQEQEEMYLLYIV